MDPSDFCIFDSGKQSPIVYRRVDGVWYEWWDEGDEASQKKVMELQTAGARTLHTTEELIAATS